MVGVGVGGAVLLALGVALVIAPSREAAGTERGATAPSSSAHEAAAPPDIAPPPEVARAPALETPTADPAEEPETTTDMLAENAAPHPELELLRRAIEQARRARVAQAAPPEGAPGASAATPTDDTAQPPGRLGREYITAAVREMRPLLAECYELARDAAHRAGDDAPEGRLVMRFVVGGEPGVGGVIEESEVLGTSTLRDPVLDECFAETLRTLELPPPEEGGQVEVRYPFELSSDEP